MASVVDELVVVLGLDPTKFNQGQKDALDAFRRTQEAAVAGGKDIEAQGKKTTEFFSGLKREALGLLAVFLGGRGIKEFVGYITSLDAGGARLAKTFGVSARDLSAWQSVVEQVGGKAESATAAIGGLSESVQNSMLTGQFDTGLLSVFKRIGLASKDYTDPTKILLGLSKLSEGMDPARFAAWARLVPGMNQDMINALIQGPAAVQKRLAAANEAGGPFADSIREAELYQEKLAILDRTVTSLGRNLFTSLAPALIAVAEKMRELFAGWNKTPEQAGDAHQNMVKRFGDPRGFIEFWMGPKTAEEMYGPKPAGATAGPGSSSGRQAPGIGVFSGATSFQIIEGGQVIASGPLAPSGAPVAGATVGAKGAAAASSIVNDRSSRSTRTSSSSVKIDTINVNAPRATDATGVAGGIHDAIENQSFGASANGGAQ